MKRMVVIGYPIKHSLSPIMHNAALKEINLDNEFIYEKLEVAPEKLKEFSKKIRKKEITGANVTIPHKQKMFNLIDKRTKEAELIGAVNTVYLENNKLVGHCTDGIGCLNSLKESNVEIKGKNILIIGAGGSARAIAFTLALNNINKLTIINKTIKKAENLADEVRKKTNIPTEGKGLDLLNKELLKNNIVIHCTPTGMKHKAEGQTLITKEMLSKKPIVMDIVYNPLKTKLLGEAEEAGCKVIDGIGMLVHQGAVGFEIWTGKKAPTHVMRNALIKSLKEKE